MKKWFTFVYIVKKYPVPQSKTSDLSYRNFLTEAEEKEMFSPSAGSIKKIMDFANSYEVLNSDSTGHIELITN